MPLSEFIKKEVDSIVDEWEGFARKLGVGKHLSVEDLRDEARVLLLHIADDIASAQTADERHGKSRGERPESGPGVTEAARTHARDRFAQGFTLDEMVSEYRALRASVVRRWRDSLTDGDGNIAEDLVRFGEAMDQALTESIHRYSERLERARSLLLGVLGHDLRSPLAAVRSSGQYLLYSDGLSGAQTVAVGRILRSVERMQLMVRDLLDFTATRLGKELPVSRAPVNLGKICRQAVEELTAYHPERTLRFECSGDLSGQWDSERVRQMVSNLAANAIQHGDAGTPVAVVARSEGEGVTIEVHNSGRPIPDDARATLFDPLAGGRREERKAGTSGLGLGLYIACAIARAHGGSIAVKSTEAEGTTFTAWLPRNPRGSQEQ